MNNLNMPDFSGNNEIQKGQELSPEQKAGILTDEVIEAFKKNSGDFMRHQQILNDLKQSLVQFAAEQDDGEKLGRLRDRNELVWNLADNMPDFDTQALYQKRGSLLSIGVAVILGWLAGGLVSTLLGLIGLGGEVMRPLMIFVFIFLEDWISCNPAARKIFLTIFGLGALARFASLVASGLFRFTGISSLRQILFGSARVNMFKSVWLIGGAFVVMLFLSKKVAGLDLPAFRQSLQKQILQRLRLLKYVIAEIGERDSLIHDYEANAAVQPDQSRCPKNNCELAIAVMDMLGSLDQDKRTYLQKVLERTGYLPKDSTGNSEYFIWDSEQHSKLYDTVGIVHNGDRCKVLKAPYTIGDKTVKGHAQRVAHKF